MEDILNCARYWQNITLGVDGTDKTIFLRLQLGCPFISSQNGTWNWRGSKSALEVQVICSVYAEVSESQECVELRLAARGDGLGGHELLDAVGTLLKSSDSFLAIWILLVTLIRNYVLCSDLWMSSSFLWTVKDSSETCSLCLRQLGTPSSASLA
jgi:hypothetical protein